MDKFKQDPQQSIKAAFDSVNLINKLVLEPKDDENKDAVKRNVSHLNLMLKKDFFTKELTEQQKTDIDSCILAGTTYISE